jgi:hypothetical protein
MASNKYLDFDLQITPSTPAGYRARVLNSPAGQATGTFQPPFGDEELALFVQQLLQVQNRQSSLFEKGMLRTVGQQLFEALFQGELYACLSRCLDEAQRQDAGLRIRLRLNEAPALVNLPWEYLYYPAADRFLALSTSSPLIHYLELPQPVRPLTVRPPVGILGVIASPSDLPPLNADQEWAKLQNALEKLVSQGTIRLTRLQNPTLAQLQQTLRQTEAHVIHFIGHGLYDSATHEGRIALTSANGQAELIGAQQLGQLLHNETTLRLVVLNLCEGSRTSVDDPFAGVAQRLVQQGVPAVIALQFPMTDAAAITLAEEFYTALADGYGVDAALTEARVAVATRHRGGEWGAPKLFLRAADGLLWQMTQVEAVPASAGAAVGETLDALPGLMTSATVRALVATFRTNFQASSQQIDLLVQYKDVHDLLHKLQFRCYNVIIQEVGRFPADSLAVDNLLNYEVTLQDLLAELRAVAARSVIPPAELAWIDDVAQAQAKLNEALVQLNLESLKRAVWLLKRVIALQPSSVNQRLNAAARALRLDALIEAMMAIYEALRGSGASVERATQFQTGVEALRSLHMRLTSLVEAHDHWQAFERILSRIDDVLIYDLSELEFSWPDVQMRMELLCQESNEEWVQLLQADGAQVVSALMAQNPALIQRYFRRYRQRAGNRFYQVDSMLKTLCEELRKVGEPLASVLKLLE